MVYVGDMSVSPSTTATYDLCLLAFVATRLFYSRPEGHSLTFGKNLLSLGLLLLKY